MTQQEYEAMVMSIACWWPEARTTYASFWTAAHLGAIQPQMPVTLAEIAEQIGASAAAEES